MPQALPSPTFRTLDYANRAEVVEYVRLFWRIPTRLGDEYSTEKDSGFIEKYADQAIEQENETNTFAGIVLFDGEIVGLHVLRKFSEPPLVGAHSAALWIREDHRRQGFATTLKEMGETWARRIGAHFINSNVLPGNPGMIALNEGLGYRPYKINLRKRL
jgi:RimJ/RimL family protein N-acetyltransferase